VQFMHCFSWRGCREIDILSILGGSVILKFILNKYDECVVKMKSLYLIN
jgi:hypothetical protein